MTELDAIARARSLLEEPRPAPTAPLSALGAAALAATAAVLMAGVMVLGLGFEVPLSAVDAR